MGNLQDLTGNRLDNRENNLRVCNKSDGVYSDFEDAKKIRLEAEEKYFGEFKRNEEDILNGKK